MVRAVLWKEWREQAAIIVALLALGGGVMAAAVGLGGPVTDAGPFEFAGYGQAGRLAFLMLALTAGTVIGGTLFAGEAEAGTTAYLATLPASRWRVWRGKVAAGLVLTAAAGTVLIAEGVALGAAGDGRSAAGWAAWVGVLMLAAFGWGTLGSVTCGSTLTACGVGLIEGTLAGGVYLLLAAAVFQGLDREYGFHPRRVQAESLVLVTSFLVLATPLLLSGLVYSAPDRARVAAELTPGTVATARKTVRAAARRGRTGFGVRALAWLVYRQYAVPTLVLGGLALVFGLVMLDEHAPMLVGWPSATLFIGALVGVIGWSDEQGRGASRYWGERRLPVGRLWLAKAAGGMALTLGLCALYLLPTLVREVGFDDNRGPLLPRLFGSGLLAGDAGYLGPGETGYRTLLFFTFLWPVYGFAAGHLAGLLFRKAVVAAGVAVMTAGALAGLWLPSLFAGGLHGWQVWPAPAVAVLTARLLVRAWAADRVTTRRPLAVLAAGLAVVAGLTAAGIGWRVAEVPVGPAAGDDLAFAKTIPGFEENEARREAQSGIAGYLSTDAGLRMRSAGGIVVAPPEPLPDPVPDHLKTFQAQLPWVFRTGWPADQPGLNAWMDEMFARKWDEPLLAVPGKPLGVLEDPATVSLWAAAIGYDPVRNATVLGTTEVAQLMLARGLQAQVRGDPAAYVGYLDATLALARTARNKTLADYVIMSRRVEAVAFASLDRWLERLAGRPDLLRAATAALARHEAAMPTDPDSPRLAARVVIRNAVAAPSGWSDKYFTAATGNLLPSHRRRATDDEALKARVGLETNLLGFAWAVPWEKERLTRVVGLGNDPLAAAEVVELTRGAPGVFVLPDPNIGRSELTFSAARRAALLRAALRLFEAETGEPAGKLDRLVPAYLPAIPADPFDNRPFRYRLSAGEEVVMEYLQPKFEPGLPAGGPGAWPPGVGVGGNDDPTDGQFDALAAVAGGLARHPRPLPTPPWLDPLTLENHEFFDALAAAAGGTVQWPLPPLAGDDAGAGPPPDGPAGGPPRRVPRPPDRRVVEVAAGQGVLWSVGPDRSDDGGKMLPLNGVYDTNNTGDLIYVVPLPAGRQPVPNPKKKEQAP